MESGRPKKKTATDRKVTVQFTCIIDTDFDFFEYEPNTVNNIDDAYLEVVNWLNDNNAGIVDLIRDWSVGPFEMEIHTEHSYRILGDDGTLLAKKDV
jgi:hypothetical protein